MNNVDPDELEDLKESSDEAAHEAAERKAEYDEAVAEDSREKADNPPPAEGEGE